MMIVFLVIFGAIGVILLWVNFMVVINMVWFMVNNNVYVQVVLVMLIGLVSKNVILIVEFGNQVMDLGMKIFQVVVFVVKERM